MELPLAIHWYCIIVPLPGVELAAESCVTPPAQTSVEPVITAVGMVPAFSVTGKFAEVVEHPFEFVTTIE
jgi:hypothetical protein